MKSSLVAVSPHQHMQLQELGNKVGIDEEFGEDLVCKPETKIQEAA